MSALIWVIAALLLVGAEALSGELVLLMLAGGAASAAVVDAIADTPAWVEGVVFAVVSIMLLGTVRPVVRRHLRRGPTVSMNVQALEGKSATVVSTVDDQDGQVRIEGDLWTARPLNQHDVYETGEKVTVMRIDGATALVWRG